MNRIQKQLTITRSGERWIIESVPPGEIRKEATTLGDAVYEIMSLFVSESDLDDLDDVREALKSGDIATLDEVETSYAEGKLDGIALVKDELTRPLEDVIETARSLINRLDYLLDEAKR